MKYYLEIYSEIGSDCMLSFESDNPFMSINKGDIISYGCFNNPAGDLIVKNINHFIWTSPNHETNHKIMLYTTKWEGQK